MIALYRILCGGMFIALLILLTIGHPLFADQVDATEPSRQLLFREDWTQSPWAIPITQEHVVHSELTLHLYGGAEEFLEKSHHDDIENDPYYVWSGLVQSSWLAGLSWSEGEMDLSVNGAVRWRTRQSGNHALRIALGLLDGSWIVSEPLVGESENWQVTMHSIPDVNWYKLSFEGTISRGDLVKDPNVTQVVEIGFTDLKAGGGSPQSSRVDWIEVYGVPTSTVYPCPLKSAVSDDTYCTQSESYLTDGQLGTRWFAYGKPVQLYLELESPAIVDAVSMAWYRGNERWYQFSMAASLDGRSWNPILPVCSTRPDSLDLQCYNVPDTFTCYLCVIGYGNEINLWNSISEIQVFTKESGEPADE